MICTAWVRGWLRSRGRLCKGVFKNWVWWRLAPWRPNPEGKGIWAYLAALLALPLCSNSGGGSRLAIHAHIPLRRHTQFLNTP